MRGTQIQKVISSLILGLFSVSALLAGGTVEARADASNDGIKFLRICRKSRVCEVRGLALRTLAKGTAVPENLRQLVPRLLVIAGVQVDLWNDSILEGPFEAEPAINLDVIEGVFRNGRMIAYRITYSSRAWRVDPSGARLEEGRIVESAFVSIALKGFFRDERAVAEFRPSS